MNNKKNVNDASEKDVQKNLEEAKKDLVTGYPDYDEEAKGNKKSIEEIVKEGAEKASQYIDEDTEVMKDFNPADYTFNRMIEYTQLTIRKFLNRVEAGTEEEKRNFKTAFSLLFCWYNYRKTVC